jgi:predicted RND superfamily exporter protein
MEKACTSYVGILRSPVVRWCIILFWVLGAACGLIWGFNGFFSSTSLTFSPTDGTPSKAAATAYSEAFAGTHTGEAILAYVKSLDGSSLIPQHGIGCYEKVNETYVAGKLLNLFNDLNSTIFSYDYPQIIESITNYCDLADVLPNISLIQPIIQGASKMLMSPSNDSTYVLITAKTPGDPLDVTSANMNQMREATANITKFAEWLNAKLPGIEQNYSNISIRLTGLPIFGIDVLTGVEEQLVSCEGIAFPVALVVLTIMLRSLRLLIIPIMCIVSSLLISFLIMWPVALNYNVIQFCPSVMSSVTLALSIDYSLFLLSRFREEVRSKKNPSRTQVIINMMQFAGHTVLVSGCTICLCFLALLFFPTEMLASVGIGSSISIAMTILCNCTLTPVMLITFYPFFADFESFGFACCCCRQRCLRREEQRSLKPFTNSIDINNEEVPMAEALLGMLGMHDDLAKGSQLVEYNTTSCWYNLGKCTVRLNWIVIVVMAAAVVPFAYFVPQLILLHDFSLVAPRGSNSSEAYSDLVNTFGAGTLFSSQLLVIPKDNISVLSDEFFTRSRYYMGNLTKIMNGTTILGPSYICLQGINTNKNQDCGVEYELVHTALNESEIIMQQYKKNQTFPYPFQQLLNKYNVPLSTAYNLLDTIINQVFYGEYVNLNATAMTFTVNIPNGIDVFSAQGGKWIDSMRDAIEQLEAPNGQSKQDAIYLCKGDTVTHDAIDEVLAYFPKIVAGTLAAVFVLVAIAFRSLFVPLRSVVTISMTLAWVYGFAIMTYQVGILDWMNWPSLMSTNGFYWMAPIMSFSVIVGVGLDYDIFLLTRVQEYRRNGLGESESVIAGLSQTGHIITAAGVIMAIAFSGLLLSTEAVLNQLAFLLVFAVLVDTFIV